MTNQSDASSDISPMEKLKVNNNEMALIQLVDNHNIVNSDNHVYESSRYPVRTPEYDRKLFKLDTHEIKKKLAQSQRI